MFWVDPEEDLIFIFLSNRVYPDLAIDSMGKLSTRTRCQEAAYKAIKSYETSKK